MSVTAWAFELALTTLLPTQVIKSSISSRCGHVAQNWPLRLSLSLSHSENGIWVFRLSQEALHKDF